METHRFEQFDLYLNGKMSSEEKAYFEAELSSDTELYSTFEIYRTVELAMREKEMHLVNHSALLSSLHTLNERYFRPDSQQEEEKGVPLYSGRLARFFTGMAAAVGIILLSYFIFFTSKDSVKTLATNYYNENFMQLSQTMGNADDSLQSGIAAYNRKDYNKALSYFKSIYKSHPENSEAKKYAGLSYLAKRDYTNALKEFDELSQMQNLYSNPGTFLKAVTLLMRDNHGDRQSAKQIMEKLAGENTEGSKESREWLKSF
ncbi:tetratricopeptide repeat protein [Dyadobacter flavalbus]|uniref:Tetratricopeptide repeat protein n=1 Tax=Dyadobacter flavalbus TaxID=2579942 RepID=A0A5M8QT04_9BACT|nr:tetratricopeptide repeat protein [Dyadobacter flavalbus]KAA6439387.1 tetratricopeptide repeat protein [Dyadobacter flavalbus]